MNKDFIERYRREFPVVLAFVSNTLIGRGTKNKYYYIEQAKNIQEHFGNMFFRKYYKLPNTATNDEINNCIMQTLCSACEVKENELITEDDIKRIAQEQYAAIEKEYYKQKAKEIRKEMEEARKSMFELGYEIK